MKKKTVLSRVVLSLFLAFAFNIMVHAGGPPPSSPPSSIGGLVWNDLSEDGEVDAGEPGLDLIYVQLCGGTDTTIDCDAFTAFAPTDSSGNYLFVEDDYSSYSGTHLVAMVNLVSVPPSSHNFTTDPELYFQRLGSGAPIVDADFGIHFQAVPVPAAVWLFGSGLLGLIGMARRKRAV